MVLLLIPIRAGSKAQPLLAHAPTDPSPRCEKQLRVLWDAPVESRTSLWNPAPTSAISRYPDAAAAESLEFRWGQSTTEPSAWLDTPHSDIH